MFWRKKASGGLGRKCGACGKNYELTSLEIRFFRSQELPEPEFCRTCRNTERVAQGTDYTAPRLLSRK